MQAKTASANSRLLPFEVVAFLVAFEKGGDRGDQPVRRVAIGAIAAEAVEGRIACGNLGFVILEHDDRCRNMEGVEITLPRGGKDRIQVRRFKRRESARFPKGCGTPLAAADTRNLH